MEVIKMERPVNRYKVSNFSKVDTTKYMNDDIYYTDNEEGDMINSKLKNFNKINTKKYMNDYIIYKDKEVGVLINSKIKKFPGSMPNLKDYVKQSDIENFITEQDVQTLIDESIPDVSNFITEEDVPD